MLRYLHEQGVAVPDEISVAGFGGYDIGAVTYPALTTIAFDYELVGMRTAQGMLELLAGREMVSDSDLPASSLWSGKACVHWIRSDRRVLSGRYCLRTKFPFTRMNIFANRVDRPLGIEYNIIR